MTERLADISARIDNVRQLDSVVTAMRGIAASRAQQSRNLLAGIESYTDAISLAIGEALCCVAGDGSPATGAPEGGHALVVFCAEQGFAGGLSDHMLDVAGATTGRSQLIVVGSRGAAIAGERGLVARKIVAMPTRIDGVPALANLIADTLYAGIAAGSIARVSILYPRLDGGHDLKIERSMLFPIEFEKFPKRTSAVPPLLTLAPETLIERLAAEYVYARLCEAAMHAYAAENQARMDTMSAASNNIDRTLEALKQRENQIRQEEVTAEIIELSCGTRGLE